MLRWALVVIFLWFGCMKFTSYEAMGIAPLMKNSTIMSWIPAVFGVQGGSYFIGTVELATAAALIIGAFNKTASALGAAMSCLTYAVTLTFFLSTPGVAEPKRWGGLRHGVSLAQVQQPPLVSVFGHALDSGVGALVAGIRAGGLNYADAFCH